MASQNVPEKIDKYQILSVIGKGAMGIVYHAYDPIVKRDVAIKLLSSLDLDEPELISRFEREARLAGGLRHPNIVTIYDLGQFQGRPYIAMEFLLGKDLEAVIKEKQSLSVERKVDIILQICKGLHAAHQKGIIHRDIKPANIRLQDDESAKIMDFGIARMGTSQLTKSGYIIGTLQYMSPEQISGEALDVRTDIFSTGVIAYELFTYINPFAGGGAVDIMYRILNIRPKPVHDLPEEYNTELNQIIMRSLEKNRELRYPSAKEMAQDLEEFLFYLKSMKFQPKASRAAAYEEDRTRNITAEELEQIMAQTDHRPTPSTQNTIVSKPQMPPTVGMDFRSQTLPAFGSQPEQPAPRTGIGANYSETAQQVLMRQPSTWQEKKFYILGALLALLFIGGLILTASFTGHLPGASTSLAVTTKPPGAELWINGKMVGTTPVVINQKRQMHLTFKMEGYKDKEFDLSPEAWPAAVNMTLDPITKEQPEPQPNPYYIALSSTPAGAEVLLDGQSQGTTPGKIKLADEKVHEIILRLSGYKEEKRTIDRNTDPKLTIQLEPEVTAGFVKYSGRYPVTIYSDGKALKTPIELPPGSYNLTIRARKGAFIRMTRKVDVVSGETATITDPAMGKLTVKANPSNCRISIDGEYVDDVPILALPVQAGKHVVQFNWPAQGKKLNKTISISAGEGESLFGEPE
ncbi:protein kinase [bacterium]|nr:protein kinase [bacterium]